METLEVLRKARGLIEKGWCQGVYAKDENGKPCDPNSAAAESFCVYGALRRWAQRYSDEYDAATDRLGEEPECQHGISLFNDHEDRTQAEVLALFDRTIAKLETAS
jgi:hypothetical protein